MKVLLLILNLLFSSQVLALEISKTLPFEEPVQVKKIVLRKEILINDLMKLHRNFDFESERMIAGKFESKRSKKSYLDTLRSKLEGTKNDLRL